jgi:homoserine kinase type II
MAVYTHITQAQLEAYLRAFSLAPLASFSGIASGVSNTNYRVELADGHQLILTLFEERTPWDDLPYFLALMEHLAALGIPCPRPVRAMNGESLHIIAEHPAAMVSYLDGASVTKPDNLHCAAMGKQMGRMHRAVVDFPVTRRNSMGPTVWQDLLAKGDDGSQEMANIRHHAQHIQAHWPTHLPQGAIHADLFPDNVFFNGHELTGVIDWYFACHDSFAYDLAIALNAWCVEPDGSIAPNHARSLLHAYQAERPLFADECAAMPLLLQGAALRFLSSRQYDWLHHPADAVLTPKDPTEYKRILAFHLDNPLVFHDWLL